MKQIFLTDVPKVTLTGFENKKTQITVFFHGQSPLKDFDMFIKTVSLV